MEAAIDQNLIIMPFNSYLRGWLTRLVIQSAHIPLTFRSAFLMEKRFKPTIIACCQISGKGFLSQTVICTVRGR